jgi:hypothetical protein
MKLTLILIACLLLTGCTTVQYGDLKYTRTIFDQEIQHIEVLVDSDGSATLIMDGQKSDADYIIELAKYFAGYQTGITQ